MNFNKKKLLICFTASFPYGGRETYFETELKYLANRFDRIIIIPKYNPYHQDLERSIPENVTVYEPLVGNGRIKRVIQGIFNFSPIILYLKEFFSMRVYKDKYHFFVWFTSLIMFRISYKNIKTILESFSDNDIIFYSYWAEAPLILTRRFRNLKTVVRMHRGDFYVEEHKGYLPLRKEIYSNATLLLPISEDISSRLINFYNINRNKLYRSYLGTEPYISQVCDNSEKIIRIVSCSRVDAIKRVDLIAEAVLSINQNVLVEWHHFGDGNLFSDLQMLTKNISNNIKVVLHGWAQQKEIYDFYTQNYVHWFVNVSLHEGVPVSIMEAMSFSIPVIASNVGATSELVNEKNGYLVDKDLDSNYLKSLLLKVNTDFYESQRREAYSTWNTKFNSTKNYSLLADKLSSL